MNNLASSPRTTAHALLMLHCSASSGRQWDGLAEVFADHHHVHAPDLHGYGATDPWVGPGPLTLAAEAAQAAGELPARGQALHVVGHSYGGAVALRFAVDQPWRVKSLTLIEPVAFHVLRTGSRGDRRLLDTVQQLAASVTRGVVTGDYHQAMERFVDFWSGQGAWAHTSPETRRRLSRHAPKVTLDFHAAVNERATLHAYRRRFRFPVVIVRGAQSPRPTHRIAEMLNEAVPGSCLITIPGGGHMLPLSHPEPVRRVVVEHVEAADAAGQRAA